MNIYSILVVGATSAIAQATVRALVNTSRVLVLAGRNSERLEALAGDIRVRGACTVHTLSYDAERDILLNLVAEAKELIGSTPDVVLIAHAILPEHESVICNPEATARVLTINTTSVIALCATVAYYFEQRGSGTLAVISSVAADRGRQSNFLYSASKAALDVYLDGLHLRWRARSPLLRVLTIKPGYVRTPMTAHLEHMLFPASAERIGIAIARLLERGACGKRYIPWWWRPIMTLVRLLPDFVMVRVKQ